MEWKTIESAPKDQHITLYCEDSEVLLYECRWNKDLKRWETLNEDVAVYKGDFQWVSLSQYGDTPSHWIIIDAPKKLKGGGR